MENKEKRMIMARNKINTLLNKWNSKNDINDVNFLATYNEPRLSVVDDTNHEVAISNENPRLVIMRFRQVFSDNYHSRELDFNILDALDELLEEFNSENIKIEI